MKSRTRRALSPWVALFVASTLGAIGCSSSAEPAEVMILEAITPTDLTGVVTTEVRPAPTVRVRNQSGTPKAGVVVTFEVAPSGAIANTSVATNLDGIASVGTWTLGGVPGMQIVTARSRGLSTVAFRAAATPASGSVTGIVRGSPISLLSVAANGPGQSRFAWVKYTREDDATGSFTFDGLAVGEWTLSFSGVHPWSGVFPGMRLNADTALAVTVLPNQTVVLPELVLRPVAPFIVVATERCPWSFTGPPTLDDWAACDSGYWGGIDVEVEVKGIAGTATAGARYLFPIPQEQWYFEIHDVLPGEYDVSVVPAPSASGLACKSGWRLVSWRESPIRIRVDRGLAYAEFEYWCQS